MALAYTVATHQLEMPSVFPDPVATRMLPVRSELIPIGPSSLPASEDMRLYVLLYHRFADDVTVAAMASGVEQLVVLNAGLDTTCYRRGYAATRLFEIDDRQAQAWKRRRLATVGIPSPRELRFVPFDDQLGIDSAALERAGYDYDRPSLVIWLSSAAFLPNSALTGTLDWVDRHRGHLEVVFDYMQRPDAVTDRTRESMTPVIPMMARLGQPLVSFFDADDLAHDLRAHRFGAVEDLSWTDLLCRYAPDHAGAADPLGGRVLHATRPAPAPVPT